MNKQELTYWVALALLPKIWTKRKNNIYVNCFMHEPKISIIDLFEQSSLWGELGLTAEEMSLFTTAHEQLANYSFLVDDLLAQGYDILPLHSDEYPKMLKSHLGTNAPTVVYTKGDKSLLQGQTIGIVGSRHAEDISLRFTDNVARRAAAGDKIVVSGFARGIDRQAFDSVLAAGGKSIIVLPQGIMTFNSGIKQYFKYIVQGRVLVMSTFAPKAPWRRELAMARNAIIYGMASQIYVAQSDDKGGTWAGVVDGLRKKRDIYVRWPASEEQNANILLIRKGAAAVDINGNTLALPDEAKKTPEEKEIEEIRDKIFSLLRTAGNLPLRDIVSKINTTWKEAKVKRHLETMPQIEKLKIRNRVFYGLKNEGNLFPNEINDIASLR